MRGRKRGTPSSGDGIPEATAFRALEAAAKAAAVAFKMTRRKFPYGKYLLSIYYNLAKHVETKNGSINAKKYYEIAGNLSYTFGELQNAKSFFEKAGDKESVAKIETYLKGNTNDSSSDYTDSSDDEKISDTAQIENTLNLVKMMDEERNKTLQLMLNADINLTDEEDRTNFIVLNKYGGIVDGNSMDHDDDDALNVEYITRQQQQQGTNYGRVDKQLLRKLWNTHRVKSKHILNFLWDVTGKSFSKRALFIADQEVNRLEKRYAGPDGMWIQNVLRSENEVKDFKEHRDSFMRKKYIKLKHREAIEHRKEVAGGTDSWQNGLRS